jgi:hypothetical protein
MNSDECNRTPEARRIAAEKTAILQMFLKHWRSGVSGEDVYQTIIESKNCECEAVLKGIDATPLDKYEGLSLRTVGIALHDAVLQHFQTLPNAKGKH